MQGITRIEATGNRMLYAEAQSTDSWVSETDENRRRGGRGGALEAFSVGCLRAPYPGSAGAGSWSNRSYWQKDLCVLWRLAR